MATANKTPAKPKRICLECGRVENTTKKVTFYKSKNPKYKFFKSIPWCKDCIKKWFDEDYKKTQNSFQSLYNLCKYLDIPYIINLANAAQGRVEKGTASSIYVGYLPQLNSSFANHYPDRCAFEHRDESEFDVVAKVDDGESQEEEKKQQRITGQDKKNKDSVIQRIGREPFEYETVDNQKFLYNTLNDMVDDSTLQDSFKLPIVIEIVTNMGHINTLNRQIAELNQSIDALMDKDSATALDKLMSMKTKLISANNSMAKDNNISSLYSNSKSKGAGTLSGMLKDMQEKNIMESTVNLYDVKTCKAIGQVAEESNAAILRQLKFDDNEFAEIVEYQRKLIQDLTSQVDNLREENRQLKIAQGDIELEVIIEPNENEIMSDRGNINENK